MKRTIVILATFVLLVAGAALGQNRGFGPPPGSPQNGAGMQKGNGPGPMVDALVQFLELTEGQLAQWKSLHEATQTLIEPLAEQRRATQEQVRTLLDGDSPDAAAVGALVIQGHQLGEQIRAIHEQLQSDLKAILTPDQLLKFEAFKAAQQALGRGRGAPGHGPGQGGPGCPNC